MRKISPPTLIVILSSLYIHHGIYSYKKNGKLFHNVSLLHQTLHTVRNLHILKSLLLIQEGDNFSYANNREGKKGFLLELSIPYVFKN